MNQYQSLAPWRGCKNVMFGYYNDYADPDLLYKGYVFNYYDVEDAMHEDFHSEFSDQLDDEIAWCGEETARKHAVEAFDKYVREKRRYVSRRANCQRIFPWQFKELARQNVNHYRKERNEH